MEQERKIRLTLLSKSHLVLLSDLWHQQGMWQNKTTPQNLQSLIPNQIQPLLSQNLET